VHVDIVLPSAASLQADRGVPRGAGRSTTLPTCAAPGGLPLALAVACPFLSRRHRAPEAAMPPRRRPTVRGSLAARRTPSPHD